jgi:non-canonical poly(A) RNA polymerase PAPD5/7
MSAFPDIACRAKAVSIDDSLGIVVDGKAAAGARDARDAALMADKRGTCAPGSSSVPAISDSADQEDKSSRSEKEQDERNASGKGKTSQNAQSFRKALQAAKANAEPRAQGDGFGGDFISFDAPPANAQAELRAAPASDPADEAEEGKKRKHGKAAADTDGGHQESAASLEVDKRSPWARGRRYHSHTQDRTVDLHNEVLDFVAFIKPTKSEIKRRETLVDLCRAIVNELWPDATLEVYGSYGSGMFLPSSDIDMVVMGCPEENPFCLRKLAAVIKADENFDKIQVIEKARVPIIKWEDVPSGIPLNVCFGQEDGLINTAWIKEQMLKLEPLQPLLLVLKQFLYNRDLNETYTGGVGSYLLTMTIISFLQHHPGRGPDFKLPETNLGALLFDYLHLYGLRFNMERMGISSRKGGMYFEKRSIGWDK